VLTILFNTFHPDQAISRNRSSRTECQEVDASNLPSQNQHKR